MPRGSGVCWSLQLVLVVHYPVGQHPRQRLARLAVERDVLVLTRPLDPLVRLVPPSPGVQPEEVRQGLARADFPDRASCPRAATRRLPSGRPRARASGAARAALSSPRPHTAGARSIGCRSSSLPCRGWPAVARGLRIRAASGCFGQQAHGFRYGRTVDDLGGRRARCRPPGRGTARLARPAARHGLDPAWHRDTDLHLRVRSGEASKEGTLAGVTIWPHRCRR